MTALVSYSTGTVSVASGGTTVTGVGAIWSGTNVKPGDLLQIGNFQTVISDVTDTLHLVIPPWGGGAQSGVAYTIWQVSPQRFAGSTAMATVNELVAAFNTSGFFVFVDVADTVPDPSLGDDGQYAFQPTTGKTWVKSAGVWTYLGIYKALNFTGAYNGATTYSYGDVMTDAGSSYVWINATPGSGHAAPNVTYWQVLAAAASGYGGTSTTSATITNTGQGLGVGIAFTTQAGLAYHGMRVRATNSASAAIWMEGTCTFSGTTLTLYTDSSNGSGTFNSWLFGIAGQQGAPGVPPLSPVAAWATATAYVVGPPASYVTNNGSSYMCLVPHTSGTFATDLAAGKWGVVAQSGTSGGADLTAYGRLTLSSGVQVMKSSYAAAPAVLLTPYGGNSGPVYNGTTFNPLSFAELTNTLANSSTGNAGPSAVVPNATYDLYLWDNASAGTLTRSDYWKTAATATMTIASPCVVTWSGSDFPDGAPIVFTTSGALPTGLTAGTMYFVKRTGAVGTPTATFNLAATVGGSAINTTGSQSGTHTGTAADNKGTVARGSGGNCELQFVNGIPLNKNAITNGPAAQRGTYYGTVRTNSTGTVDFIYGAAGSNGVAGVFNVFNAWNREDVGCRVIDTSASYTLTSSTVRQAHASAGMQVSFVVGLPVVTLDASAQLSLFTAAAAFAFGKIGLQLDDPTTYDNKGICFAGSAVSVYQIATAISSFNPSIGSHILYMNESGDGTNANTFNQDGSSNQAGLKYSMPM